MIDTSGVFALSATSFEVLLHLYFIILSLVYQTKKQKKEINNIFTCFAEDYCLNWVQWVQRSIQNILLSPVLLQLYESQISRTRICILRAL